MGKMIYSKEVKDMKAWELYVGASLWFFFMGICFFLIKKALDMTFLKKSPTFQKGYNIVESIGTGQAGAAEGKQFAQKVFSGSSKAAQEGYGYMPYNA